MERVYDVLLNNDKIRKYQSIYRQEHGKVKTFLQMIRIRLFGFSNLEEVELKYPESQSFPRENPKEFAHRFEFMDIVSFDVFDTLLLRVVEKPLDVFNFVGEKIGCMNFADIREKAELEARRINGGDEVTIKDIYREVYQRKHIDINAAMIEEMACEEAFCVANPYMLAVYKQLIADGKIIIATSDMYLSSSFIRRLLHRAGYTKIDHIYVSCEHRTTKSTGGLFRVVMNELGKEANYAHIGDNYESDVLGCQKMGWQGFHYPRVSKLGTPYRPDRMSYLAGSIYKGLVNNCIHHGKKHLSPHYEHGYICGGIMVYGFCQWLTHYAKEKSIDRFLFASRDGYIIKKVYEKYFAQVDTRYLLISRYCMQQLLFARHVDEFILQAIHTRADKQNSESKSIQTVFEEIGLESMVELLHEDGIDPSQVLNHTNKVQIEKWIYAHVDQLDALFQPARDAAAQYYRSMVDGCNRVAVVDIGWKGTCGLYLKEFLKSKGVTVDVFNALVACASTQAGDVSISSGVNSSYLFAYDFNRDLYDQHLSPSAKLHSSLMELLFTVDQPSFLQFGYEVDGKTMTYQFADADEENKECISQMQQGILDFAQDYSATLERLGMNINIPASDAYAPFAALMNKDRYNETLFGEYVFNELAAKSVGSNKRTLKEQMNR